MKSCYKGKHAFYAKLFLGAVSACAAAGSETSVNDCAQTAVCRVQNRFSGFNNFGSGTLIDKTDDGAEGLVLTCAHIFREGVGTPIVTFGNGKAHQSRLVAIDHQADLAALAIARPLREPATIATDVRAGSILYACGYGSRGKYRCAVGPPVGQAHKTGQLSLMIGDSVRGGDSGGGVFDDRGNLVAVIWGEAHGVTYASCGAPLQRFLSRVLNRKTSRVVACPGGVCRPVPSPNQLQPSISQPAQPKQEGHAAVVDRRWKDLKKQIEQLKHNKQDRGNYATLDDLQRFASSEQVEQLEQTNRQRHATLVDRMKLLAASRGARAGSAAGKFAIGALGISGPTGWAVLAAVTFGGWFVGRRLHTQRTQTKKCSAGGRCRRPFRSETPETDCRQRGGFRKRRGPHVSRSPTANRA